MHVKTAIFNGTFVKVESCPSQPVPEYAFIGRSNVGKSSLINYIANYKGLAKVAAAPGKTKTINYFLFNNQWHLVDLPGYGYAKSSKSDRKDWGKMTEDYILKRKQLQYLFLLIDCRVPPQKKDIDFIDFLGKKNIPFALVFTKNDHPKSTIEKENIVAFQKKMLESWEELPPYFITSAEKKTGKEDILSFIEKANQEFNKFASIING